MPAGIEIINDSGTVLIDETYRNLALRHKGTATLPAAPIVLAMTDDAVVAVRSTGKVYAEIANGRVHLHGDAGASVTYYVFDVPMPPISTYGIVIYNAAGEVTFDAAKQYARVVGVRSGDTAAAWIGNATYAAGRVYAVAFLQAAYKNTTTWTKVGDPGGNEYRVDVNTNYASVSIAGVTANFNYGPLVHREFINSSGGFPAFTTEKPVLRAAVIDVTNY